MSACCGALPLVLLCITWLLLALWRAPIACSSCGSSSLMRAPLGGTRGWDISSTLIVPLLADHLADAIELGEGGFQQQLVTHFGCISNLKLEGAVCLCV